MEPEPFASMTGKAARQENAFQVEFHLPIPDLLLKGSSTALRRAPNVVHEDVHRPKAFLALGDHGLHRAAVGDITDIRLDVPAFSASKCQGLSHGVHTQVNREDLGSFLGKADTGRTTVAPARPDATCTGHDGNLFFQSTHHWDNSLKP